MSRNAFPQLEREYNEALNEREERATERCTKMIHIYFPDFRDFEGILSGAINSGQVKIVSTSAGVMLQDAVPFEVPAPIPTAPRITPDTLV